MNLWKWLIVGEIALGNCCERLSNARCFWVDSGLRVRPC